MNLQAPFVHDCVNNGDLPPGRCRAPASERVAAVAEDAKSRGSMTDKADHIVWAAEAVAVFQKHSRSGDEHAIADLICDLGHLADDLGFDFLSETSDAPIVPKGSCHCPSVGLSNVPSLG